MEMKSPPHTVTVRRNPPRRARPTPISAVPISLPQSSASKQHIPSFPIQEILSIDVSGTENPKLLEKPPISDNLKVFLRIRPVSVQQRSGTSTKNTLRGKNVWPQNPNTTKIFAARTKAKQKTKSEITCLKVNDSHSVTLCPPQNLQDQRRIKSEVYEGFSHVFCADSSQDDVYEKMVKPQVEEFLQGKSGMLAALGPSGSGKTHTVFGSIREPGMVPLALRQIFLKTKSNGASQLGTLYLSMFEIYSERGKGEKIIDLFQDGGDVSMQQSIMRGLQEAAIENAQQAESLIACGLLKRATAITNSNNQSSRSQCIINIRSEPNRNDKEVDIKQTSALLTIVDLAGAEREKRTGNQGVRLLESNFINNTSMVFGLCLRSLLEHQKNPKKPLQKHFQSSLLTKYLRDYMEGKRRMTLILTAKSGDEDYHDTSFLLRQASPYMDIKFENVEEPLGNTFGMKRQSQTVPTGEQYKRMKFSKVDTRLVNAGKDAKSCQLDKGGTEVTPERVKEVQFQLPGILNIDVNDDLSLKKDAIVSTNRDRENQIMLNFSKALWNVLKQYKSELEVAKTEVASLSESLVVEKERCSMLENKLKESQFCCACGREVEAGASIVEGAGSRENGYAELAGCRNTAIDEVNLPIPSSNCNGLKHSETEIRDATVRQIGKEVFDATEKQEVSSPMLYISEFADDKQILDVADTSIIRVPVASSVRIDAVDSFQNDQGASFLEVISPCPDFENFKEQNYQEADDSCSNDGNIEDLKGTREREAIVKITGPSEVSSNYNGLNSLEAVISDANLRQTEAEIPDATVTSSTAVDSSYIAIATINKQNCQDDDDCHSNVGPDEGLVVSREREAIVEITGCELPHSLGCCSHSLVTISDDSFSSVEEGQLHHKGREVKVHIDVLNQKLLDQLLMRKEDISSSQRCNTSDVPKVEDSFPPSQCLNTRKPKRRLQPAASILLRNISDLEVHDENEKPKGPRGEKKMAVGVTKRTQGSIDLLRILKDLHL